MPESVSEQRVEEVIDHSRIDYTNVGEQGRKTLVATATLPNGFEVTVSASCVDPNDFDREIAQDICHERLKDKVWELLGFQQHPDLL